MREVDLKMDRKTLGSFKVNGKTFSIQEPTLGQLIKHTNESRRIAKEGEALRESNDFEKLAELQNDWLVDEVLVFMNGMKREDVENLTPSQRNLILNCVFGIDAPSEEEEVAPKKKRKVSPGEK